MRVVIETFDENGSPEQKAYTFPESASPQDIVAEIYQRMSFAPIDDDPSYKGWKRMTINMSTEEYAREFLD